jgi:hypothetical protein
MGITDPKKFITDLERIAASTTDRKATLQTVTEIIRRSGNYRWVGLYDVDHAAGMEAMSSSADLECRVSHLYYHEGPHRRCDWKRTINVGDVAADPRYLTTFGSTRSEIIVPIFDAAREKVIGRSTLNPNSRVRSLKKCRRYWSGARRWSVRCG